MNTATIHHMKSKIKKVSIYKAKLKCIYHFQLNFCTALIIWVAIWLVNSNKSKLVFKAQFLKTHGPFFHIYNNPEVVLLIFTDISIEVHKQMKIHKILFLSTKPGKLYTITFKILKCIKKNLTYATKVLNNKEMQWNQYRICKW